MNRSVFESRRGPLRIETAKPEPRPLLLERANPEPSMVLARIIWVLKLAAIGAATAIVLSFLFRSW